MSVELIYDTAPLGALISWSNGEPRPLERFAAKLRIWERANTCGRLVRRRSARRESGFVAPALIVVVLDSGKPGDMTLAGRQIMHSIHSQFHFKVAAPPPVGWFRILSGEGEDAELLHLARDMATAETWVQAVGRSCAHIEEITADEVAAAIVEGRAA